jgi:DNA-binding XRE family transcriptional regulator
VPGISYTQLHQRLQTLITLGTKVADAGAGTPAAQIHQWIDEAQDCLLLLEDKIPTALSDFRGVGQRFEFRVDDDDEDSSSESAYRPDGADVLWDFRFEYLGQANDILKLAATKLEMEGHSVPGAEPFPESSGAAGNPPDEKLGEELRAARKRAGESQEVACVELKCSRVTVGRWETGKQKPHIAQAKSIRDYILKHPKA